MFSQAILSLFIAFLSFVICSIISSLFSQKSLRTNLTNSLSKSSPPKNLSPLVDKTSKSFSEFVSLLLIIFKIVTSNVPPPKSNTNIFPSLFSLSLSCSPYAKAAAVGSLIILRTSNPTQLLA